MWTFYVEVMKINEPKSGESYPRLIYSEGIMPGEREDIQFQSEYDESAKEDGLFDNDLFEDIDDYEQYQ
jgi:hypothetical protein